MINTLPLPYTLTECYPRAIPNPHVTWASAAALDNRTRRTYYAGRFFCVAPFVVQYIFAWSIVVTAKPRSSAR